MKKVFGLFLAVLFFTLSIAGSSAYADELMQKTLVVTKQDLANAGATSFRLLFEIGGATVNLVKGTDENIVVQAVVSYSENSLEPSLSLITNSNGQYTANFMSGYLIWPQHFPVTHEWNITISNYTTDTDLNFALGGVMADVDLGGMPLRNLALELGGVGMSVDFSTPTTRSVENIVVGTGGAYLAMLNIGNTNVGKLSLSGGGSAFDLDFHGAYSAGNHDVFMMLAADNLNATVPLSAGEQVKAFTAITPVVVTGEGWETIARNLLYKNYITDDYESQSATIDLAIEAAASNIIIDRN
ncbi:MAG: hypothetical protein NT096_09440 [Proteobacteria bacterium]|nr:hypothetical protein [Pseudomonadota bacterium]